jgi:membrane protein implicated in regulation of membrane protease activity
MFEQAVTASNILIISGFVLILLELFIGIETGFDLVLVGISLIIGGVFGNVFDNSYVAFILASVLSLLYIAFGRKIIKQKITVTTSKTNTDQLIGKKGVMVKATSPDKTGIIKINDEEWRAASKESIKEGTEAKVLSIEGVTLQIKGV